MVDLLLVASLPLVDVFVGVAVIRDVADFRVGLDQPEAACQDKAGDEAADMGPVSDTTGGTTAGLDDRQELQTEPDSQEPVRPNGYDEEGRHECLDVSLGPEDQVSAEDTGNGTTGTEHRDEARGVATDVNQSSSDTGHQVEHQEA